MRYAADFRSVARDALRGKWTIAVIAGLIAVLLGGTGIGGPEVNFQFHGGCPQVSFEIAGQTIYSTGGGLDSEIGAFLVGGAMYVAVAAIVLATIYLILGSVVGVGYARFNLHLVDREEPSFDTLFAYFSCWKTTAAARLLKSAYILLWSLAAGRSGYHGDVQLCND